MTSTKGGQQNDYYRAGTSHYRCNYYRVWFCGRSTAKGVNNMKREKAMKKLVKSITGKNIKLKKSDRWETNWTSKIWWADDEGANDSKEFRAFFVSRCPAGNNYSDITISLLHEVGHMMCVNESFGIESDATTNQEYFITHDEWLATKWAIEYLINHPKKLKKFEKRIAR